MFNRMSLLAKIFSMGILIILCFGLVFAWVIPRVEKNIYNEKFRQTRHVVETAGGVVNFYVKQVKANAIPLQEAQLKAKEAINDMRYEGTEYFWINDMTPVMIAHPFKPELNGTDLSGNKDPNGKRLFMEMVEVCRRNGAGFVDYYWPKPGQEKPVPKISYVKLFSEWGWIVGSGIYLDDVKREIRTITFIIFCLTLLLIGICSVLAYIMARSISGPILHIAQELNSGAEQVTSSSAQIASSSQSMAEGASEQAASIEETSSTLEQMSSMTKQNADNANQADILMKEANRIVEQAYDSMNGLTKSMEEISQASQQTFKIIKTIDEIAFQTNLLALNAAVEAARAGEAGAGFAVVADEVRNLAMRAAEAAKNTAGLIEGTVQKIQDGSGLVAGTHEAFAKVTKGTARVGELVAEIAAASKEQAQGIQEVNKAVSEMEKVVQQNAASSEESASSSEEMNAMAEEITTLVRKLVVVIKGSKGEQDDSGRSLVSGVGTVPTQKDQI